jgi:Tfp pilus assembly protein PilF
MDTPFSKWQGFAVSGGLRGENANVGVFAMRQSGYWLIFLALCGCQAKTTPQTASSPAADPPAIAEALALLNQGAHEQGLELLNAAIEKQPDMGRLYGARATFYHRSGLHARALADLDRAVAAAPQDAQLLNNRGTYIFRCSTRTRRSAIWMRRCSMIPGS